MKNMSYILIIAVLCITATLFAGGPIGQISPYDQVEYSSGSFTPEWPYNFTDDPYRSDTLTSDDIYILWKFPYYGYPSRWTLFGGLTDTLQIEITLRNHTKEPYLLKGKEFEEWFVPQVFGLEQDIHKDRPIADERILGFNLRTHQGNPDTLYPKVTNNVLIFNVWNLPQGIYRLVAKATKNVPKEFFARTTGDVYELKDASDLADSINALEANYYRYRCDGNKTATKASFDSILVLNPKSVVGWALKKEWCREQGDTECAIAAIDNAIKFLEGDLDPAAPDSTEREKDIQAKRWYNHYLALFKRERERLDSK